MIYRGMFLFLVTQSHITADVLARRVFGHHLDKMGTEDPVAESFETAPWQLLDALSKSRKGLRGAHDDLLVDGGAPLSGPRSMI